MQHSTWFLRLLRIGINRADRRIRRALERRFRWVRTITQYKVRHHIPLFHEERERDLLRQLDKFPTRAIPPPVLEEIFRHILERARGYEFEVFENQIQHQPMSRRAAQHGPTLTVVGLGLMGGSLVKACRAQRPDWTIYGVDIDGSTRERARPFLDAVAKHIDPFLDQSDLVVLAMPVRAILDWFQTYGSRIQRGCVVDLGSVKSVIMAQARAAMAAPERFVGGHPLCGSEKSGFDHARPDLYIHRTFFLCRPQPLAPDAEQLVLDLVHALGAHPVWIDAETHDRWMALTSHLPQLLVSAYASWLEQHLGDQPEALAHAVGQGLSDILRLARSSYHIWGDILHENPHLNRSLHEFSSHLMHVHRVDAWENTFQLAQQFYQKVGARDLAKGPGPSRPCDGS